MLVQTLLFINVNFVSLRSARQLRRTCDDWTKLIVVFVDTIFSPFVSFKKYLCFVLLMVVFPTRKQKDVF
jgi:hypothetical protein